MIISMSGIKGKSMGVDLNMEHLIGEAKVRYNRLKSTYLTFT